MIYRFGKRQWRTVGSKILPHCRRGKSKFAVIRGQSSRELTSRAADLSPFKRLLSVVSGRVPRIQSKRYCVTPGFPWPTIINDGKLSVFVCKLQTTNSLLRLAPGTFGAIDREGRLVFNPASERVR